MGTLWVCNFPNCTTLACSNCNFSLTHHHQLLQPSLPLRQFHVQASQTKNNNTRTRIRKSRRLKSDAEICNDIRQFLASVGLPEHHIPSTKELLHHGWNDLANIVRRRGHKQIHELLTSSLNAETDSPNTEKGLGERLHSANDCEGQNEKSDSLVGDDVAAATESLPGNSSGGLCIDSTLRLDECSSVVGSSGDSSAEDGLGELKDHAEEINNVAEGNDCSSSREGLSPNFDSQSSIMPTEISGESSNSECEDSLVGRIVGEIITLPLAVPSNTSFNDSDLDAGDKEFSHSEPSNDLSLEQKDWCPLEGLDDSNNNIAEDVPSTSEVSIRENLSGDNKVDSIVYSADSSCINLDAPANLSLEEKVANFIQNGDLDPVEDHVSGISNGDESQESKSYIESEPVVDMPLGAHPPKDKNVTTLNGNSLTSKRVVPSGTLDQPLWDDHMPHEDLTTKFDKDFNAEAPKVQNQSEINHLKFMLYQKELELCRLKEQIEKEKLALSVLQTKAEAEISKARKLISDKDAELHVAEESLSGLKEVQIEFCCDGDVVEVAGSFNGWHHRIKMDPQPSTSAIDLGGSRRSRFWSTMLWLYPGVYEIKFVVDGHWRTDPQRESVTRGHICNNILRVDR
ncbi:protein PTST homolog 3, chloroplastic isoform X2 [Gastrolobium bilobum]|uniref:protein PTST homolog 3, chloroplastic isoform X2 n=1 Tax=Gastrolobium bilobum TaxID=150636 RepID=UPI002AAF46D3|nr:protein PTST homolog 3, chloroplastic isoform X2 [Gastrolobium bilobum]